MSFLGFAVVPFPELSLLIGCVCVTVSQLPLESSDSIVGPSLGARDNDPRGLVLDFVGKGLSFKIGLGDARASSVFSEDVGEISAVALSEPSLGGGP